MTTRSEIFKTAREGYRSIEPVLKSAVQVELEKIRAILYSRAVPFLRCEARLKPFESIRDNFELYGAIVGGEVQLKEFLESSTDLIGLRFVTLYNREVDIVDGELSKVLEGAKPEIVFSERDRRKGSEFGYRASHWKYRLDDKIINQAVNGCPIGVEIQVRSTLSDAWAVHSRRIAYKSARLAPEKVLREFSQASAILENLDTKMDEIASLIGESEDRPMSSTLGDWEKRAALQEAVNGELEEDAVRGIFVDLFGKDDVPDAKVFELLDDAKKAWAKFGHIAFDNYGIEDDAVKLRVILFGLNNSRYAALVPAHSRKRYSDLLAITGL